MRLVGLDEDEFAEKSPFELSGGEKRRTALAGIIAMYPKYLVLDEPMAGLDPAGRHAVSDMINGFRKKLGCSVGARYSNTALPPRFSAMRKS